MKLIPNFIYCEIRARSKGCGARLHKPVDVDDARHFILKGRHFHTGDARKVGKKKVMNKMKELAKTTKQPIRQVISESIADVKKATKAKLPSEKVMARIINRYRRNPGVPKNPQNFSELKFPEEYRNTLSKRPFLLHDSFELLELEGENFEDVHDRTLIFTTRENLKFLSDCEGLFMDGTFSVTPALFSQLYTIHGNLFEKKIQHF